MLKPRAVIGAAVVSLLLAPSPALSQTSGTNCPPVLNGNGTVTFRYCQPATTVSVNGEWDAPGTRPMTLDAQTGVWSVTTPLRNHLYSYRFNVNGTQINDPSNPPWDATGLRSEIFVPGSNSPADPTEHYSWLSPNNAVPHGKLTRHLIATPNSTGAFANGNHPVVVYTPPGYETSGHPYPMMILSHGAGGNDVDWSTQGYANYILDNLIAAGTATPMVVVMTNFNNTSGGANGFRQDVLNAYIPFVEANYRVYRDRWARAYAGLSMGAAYGHTVLINSADQFAYFGLWSPAGGGSAAPTVAQLSQPGPLRLTAVHIGSGINDGFGAQNNTAATAANLTATGIPFRVHMTPTDVTPPPPVADQQRLTAHTWDAWRELLRDALEHTLFKFADDANGSVGGTVPATLSLTLGTPASFGVFAPGIARDYTAGTTATVTTSAGDALLSVADPSASATGHLVNGSFSLPSTLQAMAARAAGDAGTLADVGGSASPTALLAYSGPASNDAVTLTFRQHIGANDPLRTGPYAKTLTLTLSTTTP
jgi:enterochelin esterase-like enzyme